MTNDDFTDRLTRRRALKGLGGLAGLSSLAGCSAEIVPGTGSGSLLRYAQVLAPLTLDPVVVDDPWSAQAAELVFQGLYEFDADLNLRPVLAAGPPSVSDDGRRYAVELVEEARFQSGVPVTAEDVKYSFEAALDGEPTPTAWEVNPVDEIRTPDERTVEFVLGEPYPAFRHSLTRSVVPKSARTDAPESFGTEDPVGSGPYAVQILRPGSYALFERWDDYWGSPTPAVERVKFVPNPARFARSMSLKTGQNDIVERIDPKMWEPTDDFSGADVVSTESFHSFFVGFNCTSGPTADPRVREAVDYLTPMDEFVTNVVEPGGRRQHSPLPNRLASEWEFPLEDWKGVPHRQSVDRAKRLFDEAGVGSWAPKVAVPQDKLRAMLAQKVVYRLDQAGFSRARVVKYDWETYRERITTGNESEYAMFVGSWPGFADPDTFLYPLFHENMQGVTNATFYNEESVMEAIARARRTTDRERRRRLYESAVTTLLEDRVHLPAFTLHNSFGVKARVEGFEPHALSHRNPELAGPDGQLRLD